MRWPRFFLLVGIAVIITLLWGFNIINVHTRSTPYKTAAFRPTIYNWSSTEPVIQPPIKAPGSHSAGPCDRWPRGILDNVQVVLKTGAAEDPDRLQTWLGTLGSCIHNLLIVSDHSATAGKHNIWDVLAILPPAYQHASNPDFAVYRAQKQVLADGGPRPTDTDAGWRLDRYKFLPMVHLARRSRASAKWFVFLETDTYVSWDNLFRLLSRLDPSRPLYIGSPLRSAADAFWFAYGGSGIVLSGAAVDRLLAGDDDAAAGLVAKPEVFARPRWIDELRRTVYGEAVLGKALRDAGVALTGLFPLFYPLGAASVPFGAAHAGGFWCEPVVALHKLGAAQAYQELWDWEARRDNRDPLLFRHLFAFLRPHAALARRGWDNLAAHSSTNASAHRSPAACADACAADPACLQYAYGVGRCRTAATVSVGARRDTEGRGVAAEHGTVVSGWMQQRIEEWVGRMDDTCEGRTSVEESVERRWGA